MRAPEMQLYVFSMSCRSMGTLLKGQLFSLLYFCSTSCWYPAYLSVSSSVLSRLNNLSKGACSPHRAGRDAAGCVAVSRCPLLGTLLIWALKGERRRKFGRALPSGGLCSLGSERLPMVSHSHPLCCLRRVTVVKLKVVIDILRATKHLCLGTTLSSQVKSTK